LQELTIARILEGRERKETQPYGLSAGRDPHGIGTGSEELYWGIVIRRAV